MWVNAIEQLGYLGSKRNETFQKFDIEYGAGAWRLAWIYGRHTLDFVQACRVYENAYFHYLRTRADLLECLVVTTSNVYDDDESNIMSGLDYTIQETKHTHIQDIAIRRCLVRLGSSFAGSELLQIRDRIGSHPLSLALSPGQVPFPRPKLIKVPNLAPAWALSESVEAFYQSNRIIQAWI